MELVINVRVFVFVNNLSSLSLIKVIFTRRLPVKYVNVFTSHHVSDAWKCPDETLPEKRQNKANN